jgi:hypothetical protein
MGKIKAVVDPTRVDELRLGRNYVRHNDIVRVTPPEGSPAGTHGFPARFQYAFEDKGGLTACVLELERNEKGVLVPCGYRFVKPERLQRKATTLDPVRQAAIRKEAKRAQAS